MSVLQSQRSESNLEYYHYAYEIRKELVNLALRDFGLKPNKKELNISERVSEEDKQTILELTRKYNRGYVIHKEPEWILEKFRNMIFDDCSKLINNITAAYNLHPTYEMEWNEHRIYQDRAIINCEQILQTLQFIMTVLPVNANKFLNYVPMLEKEITLLKRWRKKSNKLLKSIKDKES